ncbi:MAG: fucose isomerase [Clostridia bacterium]|nr:fucose isomerase [Clostridia bacterium]
MLKNMSKLLTGDILKTLCEMGHGDSLVIADGNFPAETISRKIIYCPGTDVASMYEAISQFFPIDFAYTEEPVCVMKFTPQDEAKKLPRPEAWKDYEAILHKDYPDGKLSPIDRMEFYERTKKTCLVIVTGEERIYGNLLLVKGCV